MTSVAPTPELLEVADRVVCFKSPEETLRDSVFFLAYVMTYGMPRDLRILRQVYSDNDLREALSQAPAGVFDPRSWSYWHVILGLEPVPPLPRRRLG